MDFEDFIFNLSLAGTVEVLSEGTLIRFTPRMRRTIRLSEEQQGERVTKTKEEKREASFHDRPGLC